MEPWGIRTPVSLPSNGLRFEMVEYVPGHWAERHAHTHSFIDLLLSGAQTGEWAGGEVRREPGTFAVMPPGEPHLTSSTLPTRTFQIVIPPSWAEGSEDRPLSGPCSHFEVGPLAWEMTGMWAEFRRGDDLTPLVLEGRLHRLLDRLKRESDACRDVSARWLRRAREYVREHARSGFLVGELAAEVGVAPAYLMRTYVRRYGVTLGDDARRHRVAHACRLLAGAGPSLGEVALESGFADQSHLNRTFKAHTGLTPREYRLTCVGR